MAVQFLPSQIDSSASTTPLPYTGSPFALLWSDTLLFLRSLPYVLKLFSPITTWSSGALDEFYPSAANLWTIALHLLLTIAQALFLVSIPFCIPYPLGAVLIYVGAFLWLGTRIYILINGQKSFLTSNVNLDHLPKHPEERWIFVNGVAAGHHWVQSNINRLALTFGREVLAVHNPTAGLVFDVIQCLIERDFSYSTLDVRNGYVLVREALKDPAYKKVVLILHSQGGIEGGLMIDWLFADLSDASFRKLEVYTFGSAANHFNNPIRNCSSSSGRQAQPDTADVRPDKEPDTRVIRHVEHYANSDDFVARWGVLNFTQSPEHRNNRFIGRLFVRKGGGHLLNQHYLDNMFPMDPGTGLVRDSNEFMDMLVEVDDDVVLNREPDHHRCESPSKQKPNQSNGIQSNGILPNGTHRALSAMERTNSAVRQKPVRKLSRLWKYRNGGSPA